MPNEILAKTKTEIEPTISLNSIANGAGRISAVIDNTTTKAGRGLLHVKAKTGTSPTVDTIFKFYLIRQSNGTNNVKSGGGALGDVDAAVTTEPINATMVGSIRVAGTSNLEYSESFVVDMPGDKFSFVFWNATAVTTNATAPTPSLQWEPFVDEVQ